MKKSKIQNYVVLDVETGGLPKKDELAVMDIALTEVALVIVSAEGEVLDTYDSLVKPYYGGAQYTKKAAEVSKITKQMCEEQGKPIDEVVADMTAFIDYYKVGSTKPVMVGHNLRDFDSYFMENTFAFCGADIYEFVSRFMIDTLEHCHILYPEFSAYNLGEMCSSMGIELTGAHRALPDTVANAKLWIKMLLRLRSMGGGSESFKEVGRIRYDENFKF